jgi:hypothetical protein
VWSDKWECEDLLELDKGATEEFWGVCANVYEGRNIGGELNTSHLGYIKQE